MCTSKKCVRNRCNLVSKEGLDFALFSPAFCLSFSAVSASAVGVISREGKVLPQRGNAKGRMHCKVAHLSSLYSLPHASNSSKASVAALVTGDSRGLTQANGGGNPCSFSMSSPGSPVWASNVLRLHIWLQNTFFSVLPYATVSERSASVAIWLSDLKKMRKLFSIRFYIYLGG